MLLPLETTAEHPFYELESAPWLAVGQTAGRWTDALDLQAGDRVWKADGSSGVVQSVATLKNGVLSYLYGDHLGSTVLTSNSSGAFSGQDLRHAYGRYRAGTELGTENRFTGHPSACSGTKNWMSPA